MDMLRPVSKLRKLLVEIERELGLSGISIGERDILYAFVDASSGNGSVVTTNEIRRSPIVRYMSDPTFYRCITALVDKGILELPPGRRRGAYLLVQGFFDPKH